MSDAQQQTGPDLHAIFGIDGDRESKGDPVISVERGDVDVDIDLDALTAGEPRLDLDRGLNGRNALEVDIGIEEGSRAGEEPPGPAEKDPFSGITRPSRRGSSPRFLTDVIVDMGLASRKQV